MEVTKAKELRKLMAEKICDMIREFEKETATMVADITIERTYIDYGIREKLPASINIEVKVSL